MQRQQQLFGGFTKPLDDSATTDGVQMLTAQHQRMSVKTIKLSEQQVTAQIREWMEWRGWTAHRKHVGEFIAFPRMMDFLNALIEATRRGGLTAVRDIAMKAMREWPRQKVTLGKAGLPDWFFSHPHIHPGIYIEMKATGEKPSPLQLATLEQLRRDGYNAEWFGDFDNFLAWYQRTIMKLPQPAAEEKTA